MGPAGDTLERGDKVASDPVRWSGLAAVVGGVAWILAWTILGAMPVAPPSGHREGRESFNLWGPARR